MPLTGARLTGVAHTGGMGVQGDLQRPVLVLGATGGQGGAVAAALIRAGRPVRALVRDPSSAGAARLAGAGAQLAVAEFTDREALTAAMRGVAAAFALTTPFESGPAAEVAQGRAIIDAAAAARLPHLVFSSVAGATAGTGIPHFESKATVERALAASGLPHTVVAPTYFYDNALGGYQDLLAGVLDLSLPEDHRLQQLDRSDLGSFVALVVADPGPFTGRRIELASDAPTPLQMSQALTAALGRPVRFREVPVSAIRSPDMAAMWRFLRAGGYQADIAALRQAYPTVGWTSFTTWAERTFRPGGQVTQAPPPGAASLPSRPGGRVGQVGGRGLLTERNVPHGRAEAQFLVAAQRARYRR
jgi:uncharacterized protein YbjT (DUF2867 family)